jgi:hypothetical protein
MRPQKITFGDMREMGVRGVLIYCADHHCSLSVAMSADRRPDEIAAAQKVGSNWGSLVVPSDVAALAALEGADRFSFVGV